MKPLEHFSQSFSRREFLKTTSAAASLSLIGGLSVERSAFAAGNDTIKIALIGCGGRGSGAADQALNTGNVKLVAMADTFENKLKSSLENLTTAHAKKVEVPPEHQFVGLDAYKKAMALADVVLLASPPGFRAPHFEEAVRQGKNIFMEKPLGTDAPSIRRILAANEDAKKKNLKVCVGFQRHHESGYNDIIKRIHDGAIGDVHTLRVYWRGGSRAGLPREKGETELQYQIRNWYYFTWLSGDHIVEQHCHNIDAGNWIKQAYPVRAQGVGGRQVRNGLENGQIYDHFSVEFEYEDGTRMFSMCSQIPHLFGDVSEHAIGSKGSADMGRQFAIKGPTPFRTKNNANGWQQEHHDFFGAMRKGDPFNEVEYGAKSTMTAILGRMATYSGEKIEWDDAFNSKLELAPAIDSWDAKTPVMPDADGRYPVAMPGLTKAL